MKFKNFSTHIVPVTNFLLIFLLVLSVLGFIMIFMLNPSTDNYEVSTSTKNIENNEESDSQNKDTKKKSFQQDIIGEEFY